MFKVWRHVKYLQDDQSPLKLEYDIKVLHCQCNLNSAEYVVDSADKNNHACLSLIFA